MVGGHEIAYASYLGLVNSDIALGKRIAIVNLDAHFDLRESSVASSGAPFLQANKHARERGIALDYFCLGGSESAKPRRLFSTADATGPRFLRDRDLQVSNVHMKIVQLLQWHGPDNALTLTLCMAVLP